MDGGGCRCVEITTHHSKSRNRGWSEGRIGRGPWTSGWTKTGVGVRDTFISIAFHANQNELHWNKWFAVDSRATLGVIKIVEVITVAINVRTHMERTNGVAEQPGGQRMAGN